MAHNIQLSRRSLLAVNAMTFVMTLFTRLVAKVRAGLPVLALLSWGKGEGNQAGCGRMISAKFRALGEIGTDPRSTWVLANA